MEMCRIDESRLIGAIVTSARWVVTDDMALS